MLRQNDDRERVRDASDIVRLVGEHVALKAKGREFVGLCPFHDDHRPSMNVVPGKQIFHCFVCGAGGDVFSFVQRLHKMEFREALEYLAERAGIELTRGVPERTGAEGGEVSRGDLVRANAAAAEFFGAVLRHAEHGRPGRGVIERRGIAPEMVEAFGLGLSPGRWDGLLLTIQKKGLDARAFEQAGLFKRRESGGLYDAFRNRLMFPIHDQAGRVIAFGARKIDEADEPKYLNSPETRLFEKAGTLYGLHQAVRAVQAERTAIVTEGYTDTIACHQAGVKNVVATLGTALTRRHAEVLRRLCETVVLLFDGDEAGRRAADRAVEVFFAEPIDVRIATLAGVTDAKDPDELLKREGGAAVLRRAVAGAADLLAYRYGRLRESLRGAGMSAINRAVQEELERLVQLGLGEVPPLRQRLIVRQLASITGLDEATILKSVPAGRKGASARPAGAPTAWRPSTTSELLLGCLLCEPALWMTLSAEERELVDPDRYELPAVQRVAGAALAAIDAGERPGVGTVGGWLGDDPETQGIAVALARHVESETEHDDDRLRVFWRECVRRAALDEERARGVWAMARERGETESELSAAELVRVRAARLSELGADRRILPRPPVSGS